MDVAYSRWSPDAIKIIEDIADSHFIAFDLEFSGIAPPSQSRQPGKPSLQQLYEEARGAAKKFQILQIGLTVVKEDLENGQYIVKPYNFNISPIPTLRERQFNREWSMSSGAVQFLLKNKFDFGLPLISGIPYLSRAEELQARLKLSGEEDKKRPDMILKAEDDKLVRHIMESVSKWQEQAENEKENYLNIPNDDRGKGVPGVLNRYQMRLTHQIVQNEFPDLKTSSMRDFIQITNPTPEQQERLKTLQQEHINRELGKAVGFRWVLEAIMGRDVSGMPDELFLSAVSQFPAAQDGSTPFQSYVRNLNEKLARRRSVFVGHNCFTDLIYLHHFILGELPDGVEDFQDSIHDLFPAVVDTKHLASFGSGRWKDTSLQSVEEELREETQPKIYIPPDFDRYSFNERPHEAGYDALLTATIAIKLSAKMEREGIYHNQDTLETTDDRQQAQIESFGSKEDGYVTASEDLDSQVSDAINATEQSTEPNAKHTSEATTSTANNFSRTGTLAIASAKQDSEHHLDMQSPTNPTSETSNVIAVKEKRARPKTVNWKSKTEVDKVRSAFAATNIFDVLDKDLETNSDNAGDDLMSFSDSESAVNSSERASTSVNSAEVEEMIRLGKLMPRWDGARGFWQLFGNTLQVNSSKEGVCNL